LNDCIGKIHRDKPFVVAFINEKGGVGKTTLATHTATTLYLEKQRVLLIDTDLQGSALDWSSAGNNEFPTIGLHKPESLEKELKKMSHHYDWIIIDGAGKLEKMTQAAIKCADLVIVPMQPSEYDMMGSARVIEIIKGWHEITEGNPKAYICITRKIPNTKIGREFHNALKGVGLPLMKSYTSQRIDYVNSAKDGKTVFDTGNKQAIEEITDIVEEIKGILR